MKGKKTSKKKGKKKFTTPVWTPIKINGESLDLLKVWQLNDAAHKYPEVAILRALTPGAKALAEDDTALLNCLNTSAVFSQPVNHLINRVSVPPGPPCKKAYWDFILVHGRASNAVVIHVTCFT
jgi:hypothetical protein